MKPDIYDIPYYKETDDLLSRLSIFPHLVALESGDPSHPNGRWSIVCADPIDWISGNDQHNKAELAEQVQTLMERLPKITSPLPFTGGVIGLLSYELGETHIQTKNTSSAPLYLYGLYTWAYIFDHHNEAAYLLHWPNLSTVDYDSLVAIAQPDNKGRDTFAHNQFAITSPIKPKWSQDTYLNRFKKVKDYINSGDCYQINLTQMFSGKYAGDTLHAYSSIKQAAKAPYSTYFDLGSSVLASGSPELFIEYSSGIATTKPIKGTRPVSSDKTINERNKSELLSSEKDKAENVMIVDLLRNDLSKHGTNVRVDRLCALESFETVHHLVSTVSANVSEHDYISVLFDAFPGGSITGAPKTRAMEIISDLEDFERRFYCGSCFMISCNQKLISNILIRSFIFDHDTQVVSCWAGGGIVADSVGSEEYQESLDKISKLINVIS